MAKKKTPQVRIELVKSLAGCLPKQRATVKALGLGKINSYVVKDATPVTMGMIRVVEHMVKVTEEK
ncbi:MAG: 50S ribosomal protein L30 [Sphaerochaetaceae bacterium]|nr:50S ribosomal protein L30 [Sphaerochaetaceae bacterium]